MNLTFTEKKQWESSILQCHLLFFHRLGPGKSSVTVPMPRLHLFSQRGTYKVDDIWEYFRKWSFTAQCLLGQSSFIKDRSSNRWYQLPVGSGSDSFSVSFIDILSLRLKSMCYRPHWRTDMPCNLKKTLNISWWKFFPKTEFKAKITTVFSE